MAYHRSLCSSLPPQPHFIAPSTPKARIKFHLPMNSKICQTLPNYNGCNCNRVPICSKHFFIAYWNGLITCENIMRIWPSLCLSVQTASDWGCCFSSCLLYKLIWPETFALLEAKRDVMLADTSWRPSPLLTPGVLVESGALPHSLQLPKYHLTVFWQREEQHEIWNCIERTPPLHVRQR